MKKLTPLFQFVLIVLLSVISITGAIAQPKIKKVELVMIPEHADALYKAGERVKIKEAVKT